jgi:hypothetical protein
MAMQPLAFETGTAAGTEPGRNRSLRRPALGLALAALALALGDRGRAASVPAGVFGQDPLEVLELKVRPNVIMVLDSSGSMQWWLTDNNFSLASGDHPRSRLNQAKRVLRQVVQNNQDKVSFQFGTYTQYGGSFGYQTAGAHRFQYVTSGGTFTFMDVAATELTVQRGLGDDAASNRGLQSWQIIDAQWNTLYYEEDAATDAVCTAVLPGPFPKFYARGGGAAGSLASDLQTAMNGAACTGSARANSYNVAYNVTSGAFSFSRGAGARQFRIVWGRTPNNIRNALAETSTSTTSWGTSFTTDAPWTLLYRTTGTGSSGTGLNRPWKFQETVSGSPTWFYHLRAGRLWNGETIRVDTNGAVCGMDFATAGTKTVPASITVAAADAACSPTGNSARFEWGGGSFTGNSASCNGFRSKSQLIPCDLKMPPAPTQFTTISPYIDDELPLDANGNPKDWNGDGVADYREVQDGGFAVSGISIAPSARAAGSTPIANSLIDIKGAANGADNSCVLNPEAIFPALDLNTGAATTGACPARNFTQLWNTGLSTGPWAGIPAAQRAISNHANPKEKTIVIFVTDGDDTCGSRPGSIGSGSFFAGAGAEDEARRAAYYAEELFRPIVATEPASSVQTYIVGYGGSFPITDPYYLNLIAWGGSGLGQNQPGQPDVNWQTDTETTIRNARARCTTCTDAFVAPDATSLATQLQAIIDQGASDGDFNAQQSITETVFEYVHRAPGVAPTVYDAAKPSNRYGAIVPTRFVSSFTLPGFKGQQKAYQNDGAGNPLLQWSAGDKLFAPISAAMTTCNTGPQGGNTNECTLQQLHSGATDATIRTSNARIKRRIYTTTGNGVYPYTLDNLMDGISASRVSLWPPTAPGLLAAGVADDAPKAYDTALGLPPDNPTGFPPNPVDPKCDPADARPLIATPKKPFNECWFGWLQTRLQACLGSSLPPACGDPSFAVKMRAARREAREISIAFLAGATTVPSSSGVGIKRTSAAGAAGPANTLFYKASNWMLADSELATAAVITPPLPVEPEIFVDEYVLFRDGPRPGPPAANAASALIKMGFALRNPDADGNVATNVADSARPDLKPVMTVLYAPANDMLHAFRAGPCRTPALNTVPCNETGGEELWGFVPYDQLHTVVLRAAHQPQGKANHVYSIARGARFADVFVPGIVNRGAGGLTVTSSNGAWRRLLYIGRGIGGKYMTALDVTAPGPYTSFALDATPPVPLWSRGNPDTANGLVGGPANGSAGDTAAYARMGETWSIPTVGYVDQANPIYQTPRRPGGITHVLFMGSGYGGSGEGTTFYTLDTLSGDVIATADVGSRSPAPNYANALVANAVGFQPKVFDLLKTVHPSKAFVDRVYIGDVHGRVWKFLTKDPRVPLLAADLGVDQPIGTAASLLGLPPQPSTPTPYIFVTSGADSRQAGPFRIYALRDDGAVDNFAVGAGSQDALSLFTAYDPVVPLYARTYDQGTPDANCGYPTEAFFRGTVQPAAAFECPNGITSGTCPGALGRVFYAGTRLSLPNTKFAPVTPLACGQGTYPCRSQFDSIVYALGAETGQAAYDLNAAGDDAYRIFRDSRIAAISMQSDPDPGRGGSRFAIDEGLIKGTPKPPPPPGVPPTSRTNSRNVVQTREPGVPAPSIRYGSTVCQ